MLLITESKNETFFNDFITKIENISGIDYACLLYNSYQIVKEEKINDVQDYLSCIVNIIKEGNNSNFHTYTLLNESGLIILTKLSSEPFYLVIIAGENTSVDLISLFKACQEARSNFLSLN